MGRVDEFVTAEGERICPHGETGCWWVRAGHPHSAAGYGCICLVPLELWVPVHHDQLELFWPALAEPHKWWGWHNKLLTPPAKSGTLLTSDRKES